MNHGRQKTPAVSPLETLRSVFDAFPDPVILANRAGTIVHANGSAGKLLGWDPSEMVDRSLTHIMPERMRGAHTRGLERYLQTSERRVMGKPVRVPALHRDGSELDLELNLSTMQGPDGGILFVACLRNLHERAELETQVHEQRRLLAYYSVVTALTHTATLEEVAHQLLQAVCSSLHWDLGIFWWVNPKTQRLYAFCISSPCAEELQPFIQASYALGFDLGQGWPGHVWETRKPAWRHGIDEDPRYLRAKVAKACGLREAVLMPMLFKDEVIGVLEFNNRLLTKPDDTLLNTVTSAALQVGIFLERLRVETGLRESRLAQERRATFLTDVSALLNRTLDYDKALDSVLRRAVPEFGDWIAVCLTATDDANTTILAPVALTHAQPQHKAAVEAYFKTVCQQPDAPPARCVSTGQTSHLTSHPPQDPHLPLDGQDVVPHPASGIAVPLIARNEVLGCCYVCSNLPNRYQAEDAALLRELADHMAYALENARLYRETKKAVTTRDTFLSIASHELKTPLTALLLQTQTMQRQLTRTPEQALAKLPKNFAFIVAQVVRLNDLVTHMLDISRIVASRVEINVRPADMVEVIHSITSLYSGDNGASYPPLLYEGPQRLMGQWDAGRIAQVLTNLVSNAIKFGESKPITIVLAERDGWMYLSVKDQGLGIAQQDQARIFERFERAVSGRHFGGFGLGLWISRQLVQAHGGSIRVESSPGLGSTFSIALPLTTREARPPA